MLGKVAPTDEELCRTKMTAINMNVNENWTKNIPPPLHPVETEMMIGIMIVSDRAAHPSILRIIMTLTPIIRRLASRKKTNIRRQSTEIQILSLLSGSTRRIRSTKRRNRNGNEMKVKSRCG